MKRRDFLGTAGAGALLTGGILAGCGQQSDNTSPQETTGANELVPPLEIFDAVSSGTAEMGHTAAYYWKGKTPASQFFAAVPFGMTAQEMNAWLYYGGGMDLWKEVYAPHGLIPAAAGNSGVQMGGWFNKQINTVDDLKGLKMRIPGLGGEVLERAGGTPVGTPVTEIFTALQSGVIDATEWVGPYNDLAMGLRVVNEDMLAEFTARNNAALQTLINEHNVDVREFPKAVLDKLRVLSEKVVAEIADQDAMAAKVYESYRSFRKQVFAWHDISERAYLNVREG
jgi:TRAP-type mannitol/chloroaromatic compound transport system substrate-binding protein